MTHEPIRLATSKELLSTLAADTHEVKRWVERLGDTISEATGMSRIWEDVAVLWLDWQHNNVPAVSAREPRQRETSARIAGALSEMGAPTQAADRECIAKNLAHLMQRLGREARNKRDPSELCQTIYSLRSRASYSVKDYERRQALIRHLRRGRGFLRGVLVHHRHGMRRRILSDAQLASALGLSLSGFRSLEGPTPLVAALNKLRECTGYLDPTLAEAFSSFQDQGFAGAPNSVVRGSRFSEFAIDDQHASELDDYLEQLERKYRSHSGKLR